MEEGTVGASSMLQISLKDCPSIILCAGEEISAPWFDEIADSFVQGQEG